MSPVASLWFRTRAARFTLDLSSIAGDSIGRLRFGAGRLEVITQGSATYVKLGMLSTMSDRAPRWVKVDTSVLPAGLAGALQAGTDFDPGALVELLRSETDPVAVAGTETLDGVAVTHYVARFDLARLVRAEGAAPAREITEHLFGRLADPVAAVDLWVGDDGLPHRASVAAVTSDGPARVDLRLRDTVAAFAVVPPATGQMLDVTPLPGR